MTAEWRHVTGRFHEFISTLQSTPLEQARARAAAENAASRLRECWDPGPNLCDFHRPLTIGPWSSADHLVVGSHEKGTALRPARSIDVLFFLPQGRRAQVRRGNGSTRALFDELALCLSPEFAIVDVSSQGWLSVKAFDDIVVRIASCFRTTSDNFLITVPESPSLWRTTNPLAETARLREANLVSYGKASHLILMLKAWRRFHGIALESLALELLVCEFILAWIYPRRGLLFYDWMVRDFFFWLRHQARRELLTPGALECVYIGDHWLPAAEAALLHAETACRHERDNHDAEATGEWQSIFGPVFSGVCSPVMLPGPPTMARPAVLAAP